MSDELDPDQDQLSVSPDQGSKLFAKLLADDDESRHYSKESFIAHHILCCNNATFFFPHQTSDFGTYHIFKPQRLAQIRKLARQPPCMVVDEG